MKHGASESERKFQIQIFLRNVIPQNLSDSPRGWERALGTFVPLLPLAKIRRIQVLKELGRKVVWH